ncbi:asparagine synthase (glutamine-hydrolyzing) [Desulfobulbus rhabdoformis]|uniref:asparagine synthase (glutamine-hydrolyzing) n=1 Tax=Desulfobulbus rhabdoformis TaxID=34032 RepID=UPI0019632EBD|nr:asparagine synthase (glutamine-hydrolyzing) [Desulfobulbus rhabdoformis]MBM9614407.1 asparagine synthase (glutamine-hydrolyzing) [Desulfobulbus rhabdoformis]
MCGIFGYLGNITDELARTCTDRMAHRGPDDSGLWQDVGITLGHRRLAILDLSEQGKQPMSYGEDRYWITFNGEIYNFIELRGILKKDGYSFRSDSDTEVILAAYIRWGESCLEKFNGMWALAIWDRQEKELFLSRDRFGKKPLFYTALPNGFAFASEMKALFPLLNAVRPNIALVKDHSRIFRYEATDECVIKGIKRFPAGYYGRVRDDRFSLERYWCTLDHLIKAPSRYEEQVEMFRELFMDACRIRMRSDVPIGTALSGGLDSSATISAVADISQHQPGTRLSSDWQHAFVASFPGTPLDETEYAKMVTDHLGIEATFLDIDPLKALDRLSEYFYLFEDLYITSPIPFMLTYGAMREHGVKVTLDGHGADECFGGYRFDFIEALADAGCNFHKAKMVLDTYYDSFSADALRHNAELPAKPRFWLRYQAKRFLSLLLKRKGQSSLYIHHPEYGRLDNLTTLLHQRTHETILPTLLRNYDRYSMANGVEIRMPFMDHRIVSLAFSLPWTSKIRNGYSKVIIRDAASGLMPKKVAYRKSKIGFNSPIVQWMQGPLKQFLLDTINSQTFKTSNLVESDEVATLIKKVIYDPKALFTDGEKAWTKFSPYLWEQAVLRKPPPQGRKPRIS